MFGWILAVTYWSHFRSKESEAKNDLHHFEKSSGGSGGQDVDDVFNMSLFNGMMLPVWLPPGSGRMHRVAKQEAASMYNVDMKIKRVPLVSYQCHSEMIFICYHMLNIYVTLFGHGNMIHREDMSCCAMYQEKQWNCWRMSRPQMRQSTCFPSEEVQLLNHIELVSCWLMLANLTCACDRWIPLLKKKKKLDTSGVCSLTPGHKGIAKTISRLFFNYCIFLNLFDMILDNQHKSVASRDKLLCSPPGQRLHFPQLRLYPALDLTWASRLGDRMRLKFLCKAMGTGHELYLMYPYCCFQLRVSHHFRNIGFYGLDIAKICKDDVSSWELLHVSSGADCLDFVKRTSWETSHRSDSMGNLGILKCSW